MPRPATLHVCSDCAHASPRWHGQCPGCGAWNTLVEERAPAAVGRGAGGRSGGRAG
ncbi:MAG: DNA repair protein RadA, partial [Solirubrobacterales bacterium]|nr:DNA repair protein RadA [Solirubrobacterales bacterium]